MDEKSNNIKAKQRHSVEVISTAYLNYGEGGAEKYPLNANHNINIPQAQREHSGYGGVIPEMEEAKVKKEIKKIVENIEIDQNEDLFKEPKIEDPSIIQSSISIKEEMNEISNLPS